MKGKVAIVTGGAGVGVAVADVDASRADETATLVSSGGGRAIGVEVEEEAQLGVVCPGVRLQGRRPTWCRVSAPLKAELSASPPAG